MSLFLSADAHYAAVRADLESDAQDLEAESWSLAVDQQYVKKHSKEMVKRQDVIFGKCDFLGGHHTCSVNESSVPWTGTSLILNFGKLSSCFTCATHKG